MSNEAAAQVLRAGEGGVIPSDPLGGHRGPLSHGRSCRVNLANRLLCLFDDGQLNAAAAAGEELQPAAGRPVGSERATTVWLAVQDVA
jgi:hypothetical protein